MGQWGSEELGHKEEGERGGEGPRTNRERPRASRSEYQGPEDKPGSGQAAGTEKKKGKKKRGQEGAWANCNTEAADAKAGGERGRKTDKVSRPTNPRKPSESGAKGAGGRGGAGARSNHAKGEWRRAKKEGGGRRGSEGPARDRPGHKQRNGHEPGPKIRKPQGKEDKKGKAEAPKPKAGRSEEIGESRRGTAIGAAHPTRRDGRNDGQLRCGTAGGEGV